MTALVVGEPSRPGVRMFLQGTERRGHRMRRSPVWAWTRLAVGAGILVALVWWLGASPFLDALRSIDAWSLMIAAGIAVPIFARTGGFSDTLVDTHSVGKVTLQSPLAGDVAIDNADIGVLRPFRPLRLACIGDPRPSGKPRTVGWVGFHQPSA